MLDRLQCSITLVGGFEVKISFQKSIEWCYDLYVVSDESSEVVGHAKCHLTLWCSSRIIDLDYIIDLDFIDGKFPLLNYQSLVGDSFREDRAFRLMYVEFVFPG